MSILRIANYNGSRLDTLHEAIEYILRLPATNPSYMLSIGINLDDAFFFMNLSKTYWGQTHGKAYFHIIMSPDPGTQDRIGLNTMYDAGCETSEFLSSYQGNHYVVMAMHFDSDIVHFHFIVDNIDWQTGKRLSIGKKEMWDIKNCISKILVSHGIPPLLMYRRSVS